jgi:hypothetical protein
VNSSTTYSKAGGSTQIYMPPARDLFPLPLLTGLPYRGLLGSVVPQGYSSAKLDREEFLSCTLQKKVSFLEGAGLSCD